MDITPLDNVNILEWLYFKTNSFLFDYYYQKEKQYKMQLKSKRLNKEDQDYYKSLKFKCIDLYLRVSESEVVFEKKYKQKYKFPYSPGEEDILYDILFVYEEVIQDLLNINLVKSRPHEKLVFCYKYLIGGWSSKDVLFKLRKKILNNVFIEFVNQYSSDFGLPTAVVLFYFYPLEEELHKTNVQLTKLNSYFSPITLSTYLKTREKRQYFNGIVSQRVNLIDKWCERTKEKIIQNLAI